MMSKIKAPPSIGKHLFLNFSRVLGGVNRVCMVISMVALVVTSCLLTYSVVSRYLFGKPTDWQDEISMFMLFGSVFLSTATVQSVRGHVGIEYLAGILPPKVNSCRLFLVDLVGFLFCGFFTWKTTQMLLEAILEGKITTSSWGAPLWIPYGLMAFGMLLLTLQLFVQSLQHFMSLEEK